MHGVWLAVMLLLLMPGIAAGQIGSLPSDRPQPVEILPTLPPGLIYDRPLRGVAPIDLSPDTPPPATVPAGPRVLLPAPTPPGLRPRGLLHFRPTLGVSEEYSDNFRRSEDNPESNFRSRVSPGLQVFVDSATLTGSAGYTLSAAYDTLRAGEPSLQHTLAAALAWQATPRFRLTFSEAFVHHDDPDVADSLEINQDRRDFTSNRTSLVGAYAFDLTSVQPSYRYSHFSRASGTTSDAHRLGTLVSRELGRSNRASIGYEYLSSETTSSSNVGGSPDRTTRVTGHQLTGSLSREFTSRTTAGISTVYAIRDQERSAGADSSFSRWSASLFNNYVLPQRLSLRSSLGVAVLDRDGRTGQPQLTSTTSVSYWSGPATFTLDIERGFSETFGETDDAGVVQTTGIRAALSYEFSPLLSGRLFGAYREVEFTGAGTTDTSRRGDQTVYSIGVALTWEIANWLTAGLDAQHRRTDSSTRSFNENRIRASLNAAFY